MTKADREKIENAISTKKVTLWKKSKGTVVVPAKKFFEYRKHTWALHRTIETSPIYKADTWVISEVTTGAAAVHARTIKQVMEEFYKVCPGYRKIASCVKTVKGIQATMERSKAWS